MRPLRLVTLLLLGTLPGCAAPARVRPAVRQPAPSPRSEAPRAATGVWDWIFRSANEQGDLRIEQEEWHLSQDGSRLSGYYNRQVTTLSTDQRPFRCNGALAYTKTTRVRVAGEIQGDQISLRELGADTQQGPCDSGARNLMSYTGKLRGDSLLLQFAPGGSQYLTRRATSAALVSLGARQDAPQPGPGWQEDPQKLATTVPIDGVWDWELSTVDAEGDIRVEREEWHLSEANAEISGYYERTVLRTRPGGTFSCNGHSEINNATRYTIKGQRFGEKLSISEIDFKARPSACDNALRRLDTYSGAVSPSGQEMILSWGPGNQLLKKRR